MYVFDLDGTIALNEHRQHFVTRPKGERDWDAFSKACVDDTPCLAISQIMWSLRNQGYIIGILSGRGMAVYEETRAWLAINKIPYDYLDMRPIGDHRDDCELKLEMMNRFKEVYAYTGRPVHAVFDDRKKVVDMWRKEGYVCFQVALGDF